MPRTRFRPAPLAATLAVLGPAVVFAQAPPSTIDHYLCYRVARRAGSPRFVPVRKTLRDHFPPAVDVTLDRVVSLCTPVRKNGGALVHPTVHQVGYRVRGPRTPRSTHATLDQFASRTVVVSGADSLLVPSSKAAGTAGAPPYTGGTTVDHYECYRARNLGGFAPPAPPTVEDQFLIGRVTVTRVTKLCTPVDKNGEDPTAPAHAAHLVCYGIRFASGSVPRTAVSTSNQIAPERLDVRRPVELCLPALKDPQATTTTSTSTTSTTSTSLPAVPCGDPRAPGPPICWGTCPAATPICASGPGGCACVAGTTPCGSTSFPQCDGVCAPDEACQVSLTLGCTCTFQGLPCAVSGFPSCGGICPDASDGCVAVSTPDGDGCICVPVGSTCYATYLACGGTCPGGQTCGPYGIPGLCACR